MKQIRKAIICLTLILALLLTNINTSYALQTVGYWRLSYIRVLTQDYHLDRASSYSTDIKYLRRANDTITYKEVYIDSLITYIASDANKTKTVFQAEFGWCHPPMTLVPGQKVEMYTKGRVVKNTANVLDYALVRCQHWLVNPGETDTSSGGVAGSMVEVSTVNTLYEEKIKEFTFTPRRNYDSEPKEFVVSMISDNETAFLKYDYVYTWVNEPISFEQEIRVVVNGDLMVSDTPVMLVNNRTLLPLRSLLESLGANVDWDGPTKTITVSKADKIMKLQIDSNTALLNGKKDTLDVAPIIVNNRTMIPVRYLAESFDFNVGWDGENKIVSIFGE